MIPREVFRPFLGSMLALLVLSFSPALMGQAVNGTLLGIVTDTTGASVSGAKVLAIASGTGATQASVTNESRKYTFPDLQPAAHTISVEGEGFKKATQENIDLQSNSATRLDLTLQPGYVSRAVVVATAQPLLQTDRADMQFNYRSPMQRQLAFTSALAIMKDEKGEIAF